METFFGQTATYLWTQSAQIAVLCVLVGAACFALRKRTSHLRYLLWLLIVAKCLAPSLVTVSLAILPNEPEAPKATAVEPMIPILIEVPPGALETRYVASAPSTFVEPRPAKPSIVERLSEIGPKTWFGIIWLAGLCVFTVVVLVKAARIHCTLKSRRRPVDEALQNEVDEIIAAAGKAPRLWLVGGIGQPFVWGLVRGSVYLPANFARSTDRAHRRRILAHELAHVGRFDALVNVLQTIAQAIFWFHPLVWIANRSIRAEREKCCDETAIARLAASPRDYSTAIVDTLINEYKSTLPTPSLAIAGPIRNIEDRIKTIMKPGKRFYKRPTVIAIATICFLAAVVVPTTIALTERTAESSQSNETDYVKSEKEKPDVPVEGEETARETNLAWGREVNGLRAAGEFMSEKESYSPGERVEVRFHIQNVSDQSIPLEFTEPEPMNVWTPDIYNQAGNVLPVMPPIQPRGGRIVTPILKPDETLMIYRGTFTIKPLGWEGVIDQTVVFADTGKHKVAYTLDFGPFHYRPSGQYPWSGKLTTGKLEFQVDVDESDFNAKSFKGVSKADIQTVLSLLGDHTRHSLVAMPLDGRADRWKQKLTEWEARCVVLAKGAVKYLAHVAVNHSDDGYRAVACSALGETKKVQAVPPLLKCLADSSPTVRRKASRSLGHLRSVESIPEMLELLHDNAAGVRAGTSYALGHIGSRLATQGLVQAFKTEKDIEVKKAMALALGWITDPAALPVLKKELPGSTGVLRDYLEGAIRNIEDPDDWGMGLKGGMSEFEIYRLLLDNLDLSASPVSTEKAKSNIFKSSDKWTAAFQSPDGIVYYLPKKNVFYVRQKKQDSGSDLYFGPFEGNPHDIVRPARKDLEKEKFKRRETIDPDVQGEGQAEVSKLLVALEDEKYAHTPLSDLPEEVRAEIEKLRSTDTDKRAKALEALRYMGMRGKADAAVPYLTDMLGDDSEYVLWGSSLSSLTQSCSPKYTFGSEAAETIARIGKKSDKLLTLLESDDWKVRADATRAVGGLKDSRAVDKLIAFVRDKNEHRYVRGNAALALGLLKDDRATQPLIGVLKDDDSVVRKSAASALGDLGPPDAAEALTELLDDNDPQVRIAAVGSLGGIGDPEAIPALLEALGDEHRQVREVAARALSRQPDWRSLEPLIEALSDDYPNTRAAAAEALGELKDARAFEPLLGALKDNNEYVRWHAASALGNLQDSRAVEPLIAVAMNDKHIARIRAIGALGKLGGSRAIDTLIDIMRDNHTVIKRNARDALIRITQKRYGPEYDAWKDWWDKNKGDYDRAAKDATADIAMEEARRAAAMSAEGNAESLVGITLVAAVDMKNIDRYRSLGIRGGFGNGQPICDFKATPKYVSRYGNAMRKGDRFVIGSAKVSKSTDGYGNTGTKLLLWSAAPKEGLAFYCYGYDRADKSYWAIDRQEIQQALKGYFIIEGESRTTGSVGSVQGHTRESRKEALEKAGARLTLDEQGNITEIDFGGKATDRDMRLLTGLTGLRFIDLLGTDVTAEGLKHLRALPKLERLTLSGQKITDAAMAPLAEMKSLRHLQLRFTAVTDAGMEQLRNMPQLQQLSLSSRHLTDAGMVHIEALRQLKHLELRGPHFGDASLEYVAKLGQLERLDLTDWGGYRAAAASDSRDTRYTATGLAFLGQIETLRVLWVHNIGLGEAELQQLGAMKHLKVLTVMTPRLDAADTPDLRRKALDVRRTLRKALPDTRVHVGGWGFKMVDFDDPAVTVSTFEELSVKFGGIWMHWQDLQFTVRGDGSVEFSMNIGPRDKAKYKTAFKLSDEHLAELSGLLQKTNWLTAPGVNVQPGYSDATRIDISLTREDKVKNVWCHDRNAEPYLALIIFLKRLQRQEYLLYQMTVPGNLDRHSALNDVYQQIRPEKGEPVSAHPHRILDFSRFVPVLTAVIMHPDDNRYETVAIAIKILGNLKAEQVRQQITELTTATQKSEGRTSSEHQTAYVRGAAVEALITLGGEQARLHIRDMAENHLSWQRRVNEVLVEGLLKLDGADCADLLKDMCSKTKRAGWGLIRLGQAGVPAIIEILQVRDRRYMGQIYLIRQYIDNWQEVTKPIDPQVIKAVQENLYYRLGSSSTWTEYHKEFLQLAGAPELPSKNARQIAEEFLAAVKANDDSTIEVIARGGGGSWPQRLATLKELPELEKLKIVGVYTDKGENMSLALAVDPDMGQAEGPRVSIWLNFISGSVWRIGNIATQTKIQFERTVKRHLEKYPNAEPVPARTAKAALPARMVGTWHFNNPQGDDEQMAIFPDGRVVALYSNGHVDEMRYTDSIITVGEYANAKTRLSLAEDDIILQRFTHPETGAEYVKLWTRIHAQPTTELLRPLSGPGDDKDVAKAGRDKKIVEIEMRIMMADKDFIERISLDAEGNKKPEFSGESVLPAETEAVFVSGPADDPETTDLSVKGVFLDDSGVQFLLRAWQEDDSVSLLAAPKVEVIENEQAIMQSSEHIPYVAGFQEADSADAEPVPIMDTLRTDMKLTVECRIDNEKKLLMLDLVVSDMLTTGFEKRRYKKGYWYQVPKLEKYEIKSTDIPVPEGKTLLVHGPFPKGARKPFKSGKRPEYILILVKPVIAPEKGADSGSGVL